MPQTITLVTKKPFDFEGRSYVRGEFFETRPIVAAALTHSGKAGFCAGDKQTITNREVRAARPARAPRARKAAGEYSTRQMTEG